MIIISRMEWYGRAQEIIRNTKSLSTGELADLLSVTPSACGHYLNGRRDPSPKQLQIIAKYVGLSMSELFGETSDKNGIWDASVADAERAYSDAETLIETVLELYEGVSSLEPKRRILLVKRLLSDIKAGELKPTPEEIRNHMFAVLARGDI